MRKQIQCANPKCGSYKAHRSLELHYEEYSWQHIFYCTIFVITIPVALWTLIKRYSAAPDPYQMHCLHCNYKWDPRNP